MSGVSGEKCGALRGMLSRSVIFGTILCGLVLLLGSSCNFSLGTGSLRTAAHAGPTDGDLVANCGAAGLGVDFATRNCSGSQGRQVSPYDVAPPFSLPRQDPGQAIMRCQGRGVDFVTGRCM